MQNFRSSRSKVLQLSRSGPQTKTDHGKRRKAADAQSNEQSDVWSQILPKSIVKGIISVFFLKNFGVIQCNGQTKVVDATIQRHSSQNCLISQWRPSKVDLSAIKYFCQPVANTCTNISISPLPLYWLATSRDICHCEIRA